MRDHRKLMAFQKADALVVAAYEWSESLPADERYVLRSQIRRSVISVAANIVEGSARLSHGEYVNHLNIALGSAAEAAYLIDLAGRIYPHLELSGHELPRQADDLIRILVTLVARLHPQGHKPRAQSPEPRAQSLEPRAQSPEPRA